MSSHEVFVKAKYVLERYGWQRGSNGDSPIRPHCLRGAFLVALDAHGVLSDPQPLIKIERQFKDICGICSDVPQWNDSYAANKEQVIKMLDLCIEVTRPVPIPTQDLRVIDSAHHFYLE